MTRRQYWVGEDGTRAASDPGEPLAALVILCASCRKAGRKDRRLALVAVSTRPGAARMFWTLAFTSAAGPATNPWRGEGASRRLLLACGKKAGRGGMSGADGCAHAPDVPRQWIAQQLAGIAVAGTRTISSAWR